MGEVYSLPDAAVHTALPALDLERAKTFVELRDRGVPFDQSDSPGFKTVNGLVSFGSTRFAWFRDSEGNVHNLAQY